jgi:hypothetical protein
MTRSTLPADTGHLPTDIPMNERTTSLEVLLLPPGLLRPTEEFSPDRLDALTAEILASGQWPFPILVERSSLVVMDGHHRREFALRQALRRVPCLMLDYRDVELESRRPGIGVTPDEVIARGLAGRPFPPKSTRHTLRSAPPALCSWPLDSLRAADLQAALG